MDEHMHSTQRDHESVGHMTRLRQQWFTIKAAIDEMLAIYHSNEDDADDWLDEICEDFELKINFDSPLAVDD